MSQPSINIDDFGGMAAAFPTPFRLLVRDTVDSTNDELRLLAAEGAPEGLVLLAKQQNRGRGRRGAAWFAPADESLAFSLLVRPVEPQALWPRLALAAGLAVAEALDDFGASAGLKWPNDIWLGQRKVAGILVEAGPDFAIVGIGLNVNTLGFPPELDAIATSLRLETGQAHPRHKVLGAIVRHFAVRRTQIGSAFEPLLDAFRPRCVLTGHRVSLRTASGAHQGTVEGIGPGGELLLRTPIGLESWIQADEIRILPPC
jgi:BirA family biotin operon repressor/biotin-[acetyl-CoA-carboxylase] ligase